MVSKYDTKYAENKSVEATDGCRVGTVESLLGGTAALKTGYPLLRILVLSVNRNNAKYNSGCIRVAKLGL